MIRTEGGKILKYPKNIEIPVDKNDHEGFRKMLDDIKSSIKCVKKVGNFFCGNPTSVQGMLCDTCRSSSWFADVPMVTISEVSLVRMIYGKKNLDILRVLVNHLGEDYIIHGEQFGLSDRTFLQFATDINDMDTFLMLLDLGCNPDVPNNTCIVPLHTVCWFGREPFLMPLLKSGADINKRDKNSWTPLHSAAAGESLMMFKTLISYGANFFSRTKAGLSCTDFAHNRTFFVEKKYKTLFNRCRIVIIEKGTEEEKKYIRSRFLTL